jgi:RNA polymerase sigma-70 factor (ECF subfamily)
MSLRTPPAPARAADAAMTRYGRGEDDAFAPVYQFVAPRLAAYLRRRVRETARVADLVQQTFLHIHRARRTFRPGGEVHVEGGRATAPCVEELLAAKEAARRFERALAGLSQPQRAAFELVKGDGLSLVQAAAALGTTVKGVKLRTHRAYAALRLALVVPQQ